jgi:hypothetical protein
MMVDREKSPRYCTANNTIAGILLGTSMQSTAAIKRAMDSTLAGWGLGGYCSILALFSLNADDFDVFR